MMKDKSELSYLNFPTIEPLSIPDDLSRTALIAAVGFEDRAFGVIDRVLNEGKTFGNVLCIKYKPYDERNKEKEFIEKLKRMKLSPDPRSWLEFNREYPAESEDYIFEQLKKLQDYEMIWLDISAMSKLAIIVLLQGLRNFPNTLRVVYSEAKVYHPTPEEFDVVKKSLPEGKSLRFLTTGVFKTCTTSSLSTPAMQGYPLLLVASPGFNPNLFVTLKSDLSPNETILIEGKPHKGINKWRIGALRKINQQIFKEAQGKKRVASTFDYIEVIEILEQIYQKHSFTHKIAIAPAASKLQAVGIFLFKQMHPDIQIVYPTPQEFHIESYTDGVDVLWEIEFKEFKRFIEKLDNHRFRSLHALRDKLNRK